jgi:hypothetical protein
VPAPDHTRWGLLATVAVVVAAFGLALGTRSSPGSVDDAGGRPQFVIECAFSHRLADDPIVHPDHEGGAHLHDFFGNRETDASSTPTSMLGADTTCGNPGDTAAYWVPSLRAGDDLVEPWRAFAYYRPPHGVPAGAVEPYPLGLAMVAGDATATRPQPVERVGWHCGSSGRTTATPPTCPATASLSLLVTFPDCWDGERLDSPDHRSHVAYRAAGGCPPTHPVSMPQLVLDVAYQHHGRPGELRLASGSMWTAHADFLNAWDAGELARLVEDCLGRGEGCGRPTPRSVA